MTTLPSGLPDLVADDEDLARFLTQSSWYSSSKRMAKPAAFLPWDGETSVFRHGRDPVTVLWALGQTAAGTRTLHGAALFKSEVARSILLEVTSDEPPARHAVLRGWPSVGIDPEDLKSQQLEKANVIASAAELLLRVP